MAGFNWQSGLGAAASGAGIGASIGNVPGAIIGGLGGLLVGGFGGQDAAQPQMLNRDQNQAWMNQLGGYNENFQNQMKQYLGKAGGFQGQASGFLDQMAGFNPTTRYDPLAAQRQFASLSPQMQQIAKQSIGSGSAEGDLQLMQAQALRDVAGQFGGSSMDSGAFQSQAVQSMAQPRFQAAQQRQQLEAGLSGQLLGGLQSQLGQGYWNQAQLGMQNDQMRFGGLQGAAQGYQNLGAQSMQGATLYGGLTGQVLGMLNGQNEAIYNTPSQPQDPNVMGNFAQMADMFQRSGMLNPKIDVPASNFGGLNLSGNGQQGFGMPSVSQYLPSWNVGPQG